MSSKRGAGPSGQSSLTSRTSTGASSSVLLPPPPPPPPAPATPLTTATTSATASGGQSSSSSTASAAAATTSSSNRPRSTLYKVDWNDELELKFLESFFGEGGHFFRPVGINKHFNMMIAYHRFSRSMNRNVDIECLWNKLETFYDCDFLAELEEEHNRKEAALAASGAGGNPHNLPACLFPTQGSGVPEFSLPDDIFGAYKKERLQKSKGKKRRN